MLETDPITQLTLEWVNGFAGVKTPAGIGDLFLGEFLYQLHSKTRQEHSRYRVCLFFLKVHQRLLAPVTSATQEPSATDPQLPEERRSKLDRLYVQLDRALQALSVEVGLRPAA